MEKNFIPEKFVRSSLGVSKMTLYRWRLSGLPYSRVGRIIFYDQDVLNAYIAAHTSYFSHKKQNRIHE